jgi:hypothetical protein
VKNTAWPSLTTVCICLAWLSLSVHPLAKYLSRSVAAVAIAFGLLTIVTAMQWLERRNRRTHQISLAWLALLFLALTTAFAVLYPISLKHTLNSGSDREDALRLELTAVRHHQYPYAQRTFLGNPLTPLPGAMLFAAPFFLIGHIAWQNFLWLALFFLFTLRFFRNRLTALFYLALFLLFTPANLGDLTSGGDYLTNFFYIAIAIALFAASINLPIYASVAAALFLGIALSSRIIYVAALVPLLALMLRRASITRTAVMFATVLVSFSIMTLPIFAPHPLAHLLQQLQQADSKMRYIPAIFHPQLVLPVLAVLTGSIAFLIRMDMQRLFLIFSASAFVMIAPFVAATAIHAGRPTYELSYLAASVLAFGLWAFSRYERSLEAIAEAADMQAPMARTTLATLSSTVSRSVRHSSSGVSGAS